MNSFEVILRLSLSLILAGIIGWERERNHSNAGLKTHMLVGIASTIVGLISAEIIFAAGDITLKNIELSSIYRADPARLPAAVVSGVGFLGAGAILVTKRSVSGLTTAASIWAVSSMGLALGLGYYNIGIIGALFIILILVVVKRYFGLHSNKQISITYNNRNIEKRLEALLKTYNVNYHIIQYNVEEDGTYTRVYEFLSVGHTLFNELFKEVITYDNVIELKELSI